MNRGRDRGADAFLVEVPPDRVGDFRQPWFPLLEVTGERSIERCCHDVVTVAAPADDRVAFQ